MSVQKRAILLKWIKENFLPNPTCIFQGVTSSDIKKAFLLSRNGFIVREHDVKALMLDCGFSVKTPTMPNWLFDISPKSPIFKQSNVMASQGERLPLLPRAESYGYAQMEKAELTAAIIKKTDFSEKDAEKVLNSVTEVITESLVDGEKVHVHGFGSFTVRNHPIHVTRDHHSGEEIHYSDSKVPVFTASKYMKDSINK